MRVRSLIALSFLAACAAIAADNTPPVAPGVRTSTLPGDVSVVVRKDEVRIVHLRFDGRQLFMLSGVRSEREHFQTSLPFNGHGLRVDTTRSRRSWAFDVPRLGTFNIRLGGPPARGTRMILESSLCAPGFARTI